MSILIRPYEPKDLEQLHQLSQKIKWPDTKQDWEKMLKYTQDCALVAVDQFKVVGVGLGVRFAAKARLSNIITDSSYR